LRSANDVVQILVGKLCSGGQYRTQDALDHRAVINAASAAAHIFAMLCHLYFVPMKTGCFASLLGGSQYQRTSNRLGLANGLDFAPLMQYITLESVMELLCEFIIIQQPQFL
jgi:hypothetical protein